MDWTVNIKDFGPFNNVTLEIKPLTVIIGKNSLGKSLLLRLLWCLSSAEPDYRSLVLNLEISKLKDQVKEYSKSYIKAFSLSLIKGAENRIKEIFGKIEGEISLSSRLVNITVSPNGRMTPPLDELIYVEVGGNLPLHLKLKFGDLENSEYVRTKEDLDDFLFTTLTYFVYSSFTPFFQPDVVFLIDGRAGLTRIPQAIKVAQDAITRDYISSYTSLLEEFHRGNVKVDKELFEELGFSLKVVDEGGVKTPYVEMWNGITLPLSEAPSGIREVLPIALALGSRSTPVVYIEEPEAHLHPRAQKVVAKAVSRAVNDGKYVLFTTHSDYLLYSLSNLITMSRKDKNGLRPDKVAVYLLKRDGNYTKVERVKVDEDGISEDEFTKVAEELLDERGSAYE